MDEVFSVVLQEKLEVVKHHFDVLARAHIDMTEDAFLDIFRPIVESRIGPRPDTLVKLQRLYTSINVTDSEYVTWDDFSSYLLLQSERLEDAGPVAVTRDFHDTAVPAPTINHKHVLHSESIMRVITLSRPHRYVTASTDGKVKYWNATTLMHEKTVHNTNVKITDLVYSHELGCFLVSSLDKTICMYDAVGGELVKAFRGRRKYRHQSDTHEMNMREKFLVPVNFDSSKLFADRIDDPSLGNAEPIQHVLAHFKKYEEIKFIALQDLGFKRITGRDAITVVELGYPTVLCVIPAASAGGKDRLIVGLSAGDMQVYPISTSHNFNDVFVPCLLHISGAHDGKINCMLPIASLVAVATAGDDALIKLWKTEDMEPWGSKIPLGKGVVHTPDNLATDKAFQRPDPLKHGHTKSVLRLLWYEHKKLLVSCGYEKEILLWNPSIQSPLAKLEDHRVGLVDLALNIEDHQLLSLSQDNVIKVWDLQSYGTKVLQTLHDRMFAPGTTALTCMLYDQKRGAMVVCNHEVFIWPLERFVGNFPAHYTGHRLPVVGLLYHRDLQHIITADEQCVLVWDEASREVTLRLEVLAGINDIVLNHDEKLLLVSCRDGTTLVYTNYSFMLLRTVRANHHHHHHRKSNTTEEEILVTLPCYVEKPKLTNLFLSCTRHELHSYEDSANAQKTHPNRTYNLASRVVMCLLHIPPSFIILGFEDGLGLVNLCEASDRVNAIEDPHVNLFPYVSILSGPLHMEPSDEILNAFETYEKRNDARRAAEAAERISKEIRVEDVDLFRPKVTFLQQQQQSRNLKSSHNARRNHARIAQLQSCAEEEQPSVLIDTKEITNNVAKGIVECIAHIKRCGGLLVAGRGSGCVQFWDVLFATLVMSFRGSHNFGDGILAVCLDESERRLYTGDVLGYIVCYDIKRLPSHEIKERKTLFNIEPEDVLRVWCIRAHEECITTLKLVNGILYSGSSDCMITMWSPEHGNPIGIMGSKDPATVHPHTVAASRTLDFYRAHMLLRYIRVTPNCDFDHIQDHAGKHVLFHYSNVLDVNLKSCVLRLLDILMSESDDAPNERNTHQSLVQKVMPYGYYRCLNVTISTPQVAHLSVTAMEGLLPSQSVNFAASVNMISRDLMPQNTLTHNNTTAGSNLIPNQSHQEVGNDSLSASEMSLLPPQVKPRHEVSVKLPLILKPDRVFVDMSQHVASLLAAGDRHEHDALNNSDSYIVVHSPRSYASHQAKTQTELMETVISTFSGAVVAKQHEIELSNKKAWWRRVPRGGNVFLPPVPPLQHELEKMETFRKTQNFGFKKRDHAFLTQFKAQSLLYGDEGASEKWRWDGVPSLRIVTDDRPAFERQAETQLDFEASLAVASPRSVKVKVQDPPEDSDEMQLKDRKPKFTNANVRHTARKHYALGGPDTPSPTPVDLERSMLSQSLRSLGVSVNYGNGENPWSPVSPSGAVRSTLIVDGALSHRELYRVNPNNNAMLPKPPDTVRSITSKVKQFRFRPKEYDQHQQQQQGQQPQQPQPPNVRDHVYSHLKTKELTSYTAPVFSKTDFTKNDNLPGGAGPGGRRGSYIGTGTNMGSVGVRGATVKKKLLKKATYVEPDKKVM